MYSIYGLYASNKPDSYRYVGMTTKDVHERLEQHIYLASLGYTDISNYDWIRKVISRGDTVRVSVLQDNLTEHEAKVAERNWIVSLREKGHKLLNISAGGDGGPIRIGENHPLSKLTEDIVRKIKVLYFEHNWKVKDLSNTYNIHPSTVSAIMHRRIWSHVLPEFEWRANRKLNETQVVEIRERYALGEHDRDIAQDFDIASSLVWNIAIGGTYKDFGGPISKPRNGKVKGRLTPEQVVEIRERFWEGETSTAIAVEFHLSTSSVFDIVYGKTYLNVSGPISKRRYGHESHR